MKHRNRKSMMQDAGCGTMRMKLMATVMAAAMVLGTVGSFAATDSGSGAANPGGTGRRPAVGAAVGRVSGIGQTQPASGIGQTQRAVQALSSGLEPSVMAENAQSRVESAEDRLAKAALAALKEKYDALYADDFTELDALRATARSKWEAIHATNESIRAELERIREAVRALGGSEARTVLAALKAELETYRNAIDAIRNEIRAMQQQKTQAWVALRNAVRADDPDAVGEALETILTLKTQIIEKLDPLLAAKQAFLEQLKTVTVPAGSTADM